MSAAWLCASASATAGRSTSGRSTEPTTVVSGLNSSQTVQSHAPSCSPAAACSTCAAAGGAATGCSTAATGHGDQADAAPKPPPPPVTAPTAASTASSSSASQTAATSAATASAGRHVTMLARLSISASVRQHRSTLLIYLVYTKNLNFLTHRI
jgi:hypothetical protein